MRRDKLGVWDSKLEIIIYKINNKVLLYSRGNYIQYLVITHNGKESAKEYELFGCTSKINRILQMNYTSIFFKCGNQYANQKKGFNKKRYKAIVFYLCFLLHPETISNQS